MVDRVRIVVDARKTGGQPTGVGQYQRALFAELDSVASLRRLTDRGFWFHAKALFALRREPGAVYFSTESLIVPAVLGRRAMLTIHDLSPLTHPARHTLRNRFFHSMLLRVAVSRVGHIIVPTQAVKREIITFFPRATSKVSVIHEGVRFERASGSEIETREADSQRTVLYLGTIEPRKNVALLCRSFAKATRAAERSNWRLVIIGKRGWLSDAESREVDAGIYVARAAELGYQPDEAVADWLGRADLFVYPSEAEGFGLPPLEAMAAGVPVVVSDDPALTEVVGDAALVVNRGDGLEDELANVLANLMRDDERRRRLAELGSARAEQFSWSSAARATFQVATTLVRP